TRRSSARRYSGRRRWRWRRWRSESADSWGRLRAFLCLLQRLVNERVHFLHGRDLVLFLQERHGPLEHLNVDEDKPLPGLRVEDVGRPPGGLQFTLLLFGQFDHNSLLLPHATRRARRHSMRTPSLRGGRSARFCLTVWKGQPSISSREWH